MLLRIMVVAATLIASPAAATTLVAGSNSLEGTTGAAEPKLNGVVQQDTVDPFSLSDGHGTLNASVQSRVVLSVDGTYDFYWRVRDITYVATAPGGPPLSIGALRLGAFGSGVLGVNANYQTDGLGDRGPDSAYVFPDSLTSINFRFSTPLAAGESSYFMFLDTDATSYARTAVLDLSASGAPISQLRSTFGPVAAVPEPATWALMISGFGAVGAALRRQRRGRAQASAR
ncbi:PEPxxWA-CTERM sorting domain-containing protein [Sphingomonas sp. BK580]|uniref:PEPxxWA-CTERM sorting domain-containing protein n=1 Tax=Sphingomonas sp. BK580 TaxID=2586972 RepID=UPI001795B4A6|nr:PEPxxWA-CTERM sorting domain-containing protein [Sphingomonas sp. BK580]MBB3693168.1 hypothetical protein [Sphingomonas sp. BK580]